MFIFGFLVGVAATLAAMRFLMPKVMIKECKSPYNFERTIEEIQKRAEELGWRVPSIHDFGSAIKESKGEDIGPVKVLEICKPDLGYTMLKSDENKSMTCFMPCSLGVYEKRNGQTYVAKRNLKLFSMMFGGEAGEVLKQAAQEEDRITSFLLQ